MFKVIIYKYVPEDWDKTNPQYSKQVETADYPIDALNGVQEKDQLTSYEKIENPYLYGQYLLKVWEYQKMKIAFYEYTLFHLTQANAIDNIKKTNLDRRLAKTQRFGKGCCFASNPWYARYIYYPPTKYSHLLIAKVLVGNCQQGVMNQKLVKKGFDTNIGGNWKHPEMGDAFVKFYDNEFYPFAVFKCPNFK